MVTATSGNSYNQTQTIDITTGDMAKYESAGSDTLATFSDIAIGTKVDLTGDIYLYLNKGTAAEKKYNILKGSTSVTVDKASNTATLKLSYATTWSKSDTNFADVPELTNIWISEQRETTYYVEAHNKEQNDFDSYITKVNETKKWSDGIKTIDGSITYYSFSSKSNSYLMLIVGYDNANKAIFVSVVPPETYSVSYNTNSATGGVAPASQTKTQGITLALQGNTGSLVRTGYIFSGWNTQADGSGDNYAAGASYTANSAIVLYAKWITGIIYSNGITINSTTYGKTSEVVIIPQGTTAQINMTDDTAWNTYYSGSEANYKGVFLSCRKVTLSPFVMSQYEVTQELYEAVMGSNPSSGSSNPASGETQEKRPVETVSWYSAIVFCNKLSIQQELDPCYTISSKTNPDSWGAVPTSDDKAWTAATVDITKKGYRLPTEAEWEFAARGGNTSASEWKYAFAGIQAENSQIYDGTNFITTDANLATVGWYKGNADGITHEVGKKVANTLGLYDMSGNVWEWCWDWKGDVTASETVTNPLGASSGSYRVIRGGHWDDRSYSCAVSFRNGGTLNSSFNGLGFRLVRSL